MPLISGNYNPQVGILVQVAIIPQSQITTISTPLEQDGESLDLQVFMALVDTGASVTCVSNNAAQKVGLQPSGKTLMSGSTGQGPVDQYSFGLGFITGAQQTPSGTITGKHQRAFGSGV